MAGNETMKNVPKLWMAIRKRLLGNSSCGIILRMMLVFGIYYVAL